MIWGLSVSILLKAAFSQQALPGTAQNTQGKIVLLQVWKQTPSVREELLLPLKQEEKSVSKHADVKVEGNDFVLAFKNSLLSNAVLRALLG